MKFKLRLLTPLILTPVVLVPFLSSCSYEEHVEINRFQFGEGPSAAGYAVSLVTRPYSSSTYWLSNSGKTISKSNGSRSAVNVTYLIDPDKYTINDFQYRITYTQTIDGTNGSSEGTDESCTLVGTNFSFSTISIDAGYRTDLFQRRELIYIGIKSSSTGNDNYVALCNISYTLVS